MIFWIWITFWSLLDYFVLLYLHYWMYLYSSYTFCWDIETARIVKPGTHMRTKCAYMWMGLWTCAALSANISHIIYHKLKFVGFFAQTQRELMASGILCLPQVHQKLIYHAPSTNCSLNVWFACVYRPSCIHITDVWLLTFEIRPSVSGWNYQKSV